jgi:hypothetical protein
MNAFDPGRGNFLSAILGAEKGGEHNLESVID